MTSSAPTDNGGKWAPPVSVNQGLAPPKAAPMMPQNQVSTMNGHFVEVLVCTGLFCYHTVMLHHKVLSAKFRLDYKNAVCV